jgi:predicted MFS family arabinose efflux permease
VPAAGGALSHRTFRLLFAGQSISSLGDRLVPVALAFAVLDLTGSVTDLGIVLGAQTVPLVLFVLVGGVWADRLPRRRVMLLSDCVRAVAQAASATILLAGVARVWELAALQAVYGLATAFFGPAALALVPATVPAAELQRANALIALSGNFAAVLGPALAGVIVAALAPGWGLAVDAVTFVGSAAFLSAMPVIVAATRARGGMLAELRGGWSAFRSRAWLWITVGCFTLYIGLAWAPLQVLGPQVARLYLGGAGAWAAISVALGVGSVAGGLIALRVRPRHPLRVSLAVFVVATPALTALVAARAPLALIAVVALVDGATGTLFNTFWFTALQSDVADDELARVASWDYLGSLALAPVGQALSGPIAAAVGLSTALYGAAGITLVLFAATLAAPAVRNFSPPPTAPPAVSGGG